jgi:hypothetical protein
MDAAANYAEIGPGSVADQPPKPSRRRKLQLVNRTLLDGRTAPAKAFGQLQGAVVRDLGGADQLSAIELSLIEAFCGAAIVVDHLNTELMLGKQIDMSQHSAAIGAMVRVASRLGLRRRPKEINTPSLAAYLAGVAETKPDDAGLASRDADVGAPIDEAAE